MSTPRSSTAPTVRAHAALRACLPIAAAALWALTAPAVSEAGTAADAGFDNASSALSERTSAEWTNRLIIKYRRGSAGASGLAESDLAGMRETVRRQGFEFTPTRRLASGAQVMRLNRRVSVPEAESLARQIKAGDASIDYVEIDRILQPQFVPNDSQYPSQWHYFEPVGGINLERAWNRATGAGIVVAVVDTGVRPHADLVDNLLPGYDMISMSSVANDGDGRDADAADTGDAAGYGECGGGSGARGSSWHGTHVAGTVAAVANNGSGVSGVAFNAKILPVRVLGKCGGYTSDIADGVIWASGGTVAGAPVNANPARVINMSLGGSGACGPTMQAAIDGARSRGTVVVVAAGNSNANTAYFQPASCNGVINVAATTRAGGRAPYSNYGLKVDVAAPGGSTQTGAQNGILSTLNDGATGPGNDSYQYYQGTSMAAPHVAGVVALMLSANAALTPDQVEAKLKGTTRPFPANCVTCGTGIVNASGAVKSSFVLGVRADVESNDTVFTAQSAVSVPTHIDGRMNNNHDRDHFIVHLATGRTLEAVLAPNARSNYDMALLDTASGTVLASSSNRGNGQLDAIIYTNTTGGDIDVVVRVAYVSGAWSTGGTYAMNLFP